ncbi:MAG: RNA polymerase sigma factor [Gordonia polyisoprenivorans]|nr:RNA polymerase sigma factor [Gordonia polyisoprenivorans]
MVPGIRKGVEQVIARVDGRAAAGATNGTALQTLLPDLVRYAYGLTGSCHEAEDLTQGAIEMLLKQPRNAASASAYLRRSILNAYLRQRSRNTSLAAAQRLITPTHRPETEIPEPASTDLAGALALLSPLQRAVVVHRYLLDRSIATTATDLRVPEGSVRRIASEALALLRRSPLFKEAE